MSGSSRRMSSGKESSNASSNPGSSSTTANGDSIRVICRFRPPKAVEIERYAQSNKLESFALDEERASVETVQSFEVRSYNFDKLFGLGSTQSQVFDEVQSVVDSVMDGFNGTILAYGQTSSGKTWTMEGPNLLDSEAQGIIPRTIRKLFRLIKEADVNTVFTVSVSYFEIYCEKLRDLLNPQQDNMKMREVKDEGFVICDLCEVYCVDFDGVMRVIETGKGNRASAPTLMNAESSRSHSIVTVLVTQKNESTGRNIKGKLFLVDLAGSEKVSKTGAKGARLEEAKNINRSLTTLGMVINGLCDGSSHVCYRDSKLTRVLMESLGGNSKTTLIICCAPETRHLAETLSTLRFGERAKSIKNNARINEELGVSELKTLLDLARKEISQLKTMLQDQPAVSDFNVVSDMDDITCVEKELPESLLRVRIAELEAEIEDMKERTEAEVSIRIGAIAENNALKSTVIDLEERFLQCALELRKEKERQSNVEGEQCLLTETFESEIISEEETPSILDTTEKRSKSDIQDTCADLSTDINSFGEEKTENTVDTMRDSDTALLTLSASPVKLDSTEGEMDQVGASIPLEDLVQESQKLREQIETEARNAITIPLSEEASENMSSSGDASANSSPDKFANKFARLKNDYDTHVRRLLAKLAREQMARSALEDELDQANQAMWKQQQITGKESKGFFSKMFGSSSENKQGVSARERELSKQAEQLSARVAQQAAQFESMKEAQRIVLETKESVVRSLLRQNAEISLERDNFAEKVDELTSALENMTTLLRNLQSRNQAPPSPISPSHNILAPTSPSVTINGGGERGKESAIPRSDH